MTVNVGLGTQDKTERLANLTGLMDKQLQLLQMGAPILTPQDVFRTAVEMTEAMDLMPEKYWTPPEQIPPPPPPDNSLQEALIQIEAQKVQLESQKVQLEAQKAELANENAKPKKSKSKPRIWSLKPVRRMRRWSWNN